MEGENTTTLTKWKYDPPSILKKVLGNYIWTTTNNEVLLTFDDGPNPGTTPIILDTLNKHNVKAIFFCVGQNLKKHSELAESIKNAGHIIGNHTLTHKNIRLLNRTQLIQEINGFNEIYYSIFNSDTEYFRPPHGRFSFKLQHILDNYNLKNVMWSLLTFDYKNEINIVKFAVRNFLKSNSIVVFHDNEKCKDIITDAIDVAVITARDKGYSFGNPTKCLK